MQSHRVLTAATGLRCLRTMWCQKRRRMKRRVSSCSWVLVQVSCGLLSVVKSEVSSTLPDKVLHGSQVHIRIQQLKEENTLVTLGLSTFSLIYLTLVLPRLTTTHRTATTLPNTKTNKKHFLLTFALWGVWDSPTVKRKCFTLFLYEVKLSQHVGGSMTDGSQWPKDNTRVKP